MVNLTGGFVNSLMGFILPCVFHLRLTRQNRKLAQTILDTTVVIIGILAMFSSTYYTLKDLVV